MTETVLQARDKGTQDGFPMSYSATEWLRQFFKLDARDGEEVSVSSEQSEAFSLWALC